MPYVNSRTKASKSFNLSIFRIWFWTTGSIKCLQEKSSFYCNSSFKLSRSSPSWMWKIDSKETLKTFDGLLQNVKQNNRFMLLTNPLSLVFLPLFISISSFSLCTIDSPSSNSKSSNPYPKCVDPTKIYKKKRICNEEHYTHNHVLVVDLAILTNNSFEKNMFSLGKKSM